MKFTATLLFLVLAASVDAGANRRTRRSSQKKPAPPLARSDRFTGPAGAAEMLDCDVRTIYNALNDGRLKGYKFGRTVRIRLSDIDIALKPYGGADVTT